MLISQEFFILDTSYYETFSFPQSQRHFHIAFLVFDLALTLSNYEFLISQFASEAGKKNWTTGV